MGSQHGRTEDDGVGVLVVEDESVAAKAHAQYVSRLDGFHVAGIARNATQALAALSGQIYGMDPSRIALVLLDMNLPDGHGLQLLRAIRGKHIPVDVVAVTAARDLQVVQEALSLGVVQYIIKPFTFPVFKSKLEAYLAYRATLVAEDSGAEMTQHEVDAALAAIGAAPAVAAPKGVPEAVQEQITAVLSDGSALSAAEVGERIGVSRVTARRYLEALTDAGGLDRRPRYGSAGRPVLEYRLLD
ncbi:response regulator [Brevibacterium ihuae]|uniref:response regulator n=1 Tax=Brevibacterium ihuae TaxID=1631743 RepID=UPI000C78AA87|nr:response regulator [Brevibacterium ihuae]